MSPILTGQTKKLAAILTLVILGLTLWKFKKDPIEIRTPLLPPAQASAPGITPVLQAKSPVAYPALKECFDRQIVAQDLYDILLLSAPEGSILHAPPALENLHLKTPQDMELRLHSRTNDQSGKAEVILFRLDKEGYPEPHPFPSELTQASNDEKKSWFLRQGSVIMTEKIFDLHENDLHARWHDKNGLVTDLEIAFADRTLTCGNDLASCRCRR